MSASSLKGRIEQLCRMLGDGPKPYVHREEEMRAYIKELEQELIERDKRDTKRSESERHR